MASSVVWVVNGELVKEDEQASSSLRHQMPPRTWSSKSLAGELRAPSPSPRSRSIAQSTTSSVSTASSSSAFDFDMTTSNSGGAVSSSNPMFKEQAVPIVEEQLDGDEEFEGRPAAGSYITPLSEVLLEIETLKRQNKLFKPKKMSDESSSSTTSSLRSSATAALPGSGMIKRLSSMNVFSRNKA